MIKAVNLSKTYYQARTRIDAVRAANLEVLPKEAALITGPSGAGKSTLLHLLGGLDRPTEGSLFFGGVDLYGLNDSERSKIRNEKIGFVFQFYHLLPEFTSLENAMLPALIRRPRENLKAIREKAKKLLNLVGLSGRISHRPQELSGGESQRAAIARALINSPNILLCDEPTGNLDSKIGEEVMDCLFRLKDEKGMALVIVTHDENIGKDFDKRFRIRDGVLEKL